MFICVVIFEAHGLFVMFPFCMFGCTCIYPDDSCAGFAVPGDFSRCCFKFWLYNVYKLVFQAKCSALKIRLGEALFGCLQHQSPRGLFHLKDNIRLRAWFLLTIVNVFSLVIRSIEALLFRLLVYRSLMAL